jgi:hypothetical protein
MERGQALAVRAVRGTCPAVVLHTRGAFVSAGEQPARPSAIELDGLRRTCKACLHGPCARPGGHEWLERMHACDGLHALAHRKACSCRSRGSTRSYGAPAPDAAAHWTRSAFRRTRPRHKGDGGRRPEEQHDLRRSAVGTPSRSRQIGNSLWPITQSAAGRVTRQKSNPLLNVLIRNVGASRRRK